MDNTERLRLSKRLTFDKELIDAPNLCGRFTPEDLDTLGGLVHDGYRRDRNSRFKWERRMQAAMDLALQVQKAKTFPWVNCANVVFPLITIAALQFSARSYANIIQGTDIVRYRTAGGDDPGGLLRARAERIGRHMSWQVLEEDESWEEQHDRLLINLAIIGTNFIKTYYDAGRAHVTGDLVMAKDLIIDYWAKSVEDAARVTQLMPLTRNQIHERIKSGVWRDVSDQSWYKAPAPPRQEVGDLQADNRKGEEPPAVDEDAPYLFLEQHRWLDLDWDGYAEPYIVTVEERSQCVVRIVARVDSEDAVERTSKSDGSLGEIIRIKPTQYYTKYGFIPSPDGGIYDLGFGIFLGPINEAVNSCINQLIDNATFQCSIGGLIGRGFKSRSGIFTMAPWEFKRLDSVGDDIRKNLVMFPERKPPETMMPLLELLIDYANRVAGTVDPLVGENPGQNTPASTFQGMQEQGLQIYSMVFKRVWRSMKQEFQLRFERNRTYLRSHQMFGAGGKELIKREDYATPADLLAPVADPNITSTTLRLAQASAILEASMRVPGFEIDEVARDWVKAMRHPEPGRIYPGIGKTKTQLPNPKAQIEQIKAQVKGAQIQYERQKMVLELMEERRLNNAKIQQLQAQAMKFASDAQDSKAALRLQAFEIALGALEAHGKMLNDRIKVMQGMEKGDESDAEQGGMGRVAGTSGNAGVSDHAGDVEGESEGAMGGGAVSGNGSQPTGAGASATA